MIKYIPALLVILYLFSRHIEINKSEANRKIAICTEGVVCSSQSQIDCFLPELTYAPEFGIVCLK